MRIAVCVALTSALAGCPAEPARQPIEPAAKAVAPAPAAHVASPKLSCKRTDKAPSDKPPPETPDKLMPPLPEELAAGLREAQSGDQAGQYADDHLTIVSCDSKHFVDGKGEEPSHALGAMYLVVPNDCTCRGYECKFVPGDDDQMKAGDMGTVVTYIKSGRTGIGEIHVVCNNLRGG